MSATEVKTESQTHCTAAEWKQSVFDCEADKIKTGGGEKNAPTDRGGVITEGVNRRQTKHKRRNKETELWQNMIKERGPRLSLSLSPALSLSFILRSSKTNAALLRDCYQYWRDTHTHTHSAGRQALHKPSLNQSNDTQKYQTDRWRERKVAESGREEPLT